MPELFVTPVCSSSPIGCFSAVEPLGCILSNIKDLCEHLEQQQLLRAAALRVLLGCSAPASALHQLLEGLIFS